MGCNEHRHQVFKEPVKKYKYGPMKVSKRIIAEPINKEPVEMRSDLMGLNPQKNIDNSLQQRIAKFYEKDIPTYKVEPEIRKEREKTFSTSPEEDDAPLQIFLKPVQ